MAKVKFKWQFEIDENDLVIKLNDGINTILDIQHETFHMHLANKLVEIMYHEKVMGTKTDVIGFDEIQKAYELKK